MGENRDSQPFVASAASAPLEDASFLRALLEAIPASVVRLDPDQRISYINRLRGGVTLDQVIGRHVREFIAAEDFERWQTIIDEALRTGEPRSYVVQGSRPVNHGSRAHYEGHAVPIDDGDGRRAVCIVALDVSEQVARAEALHAREEQLRVAVEATGIGLWTWDVAHDRVEWSERLIEIMGCGPMPPAEYLEHMVHPDDRVRVSETMRAIRAGRFALAPHRIVRPDGEVRWLLPCGRLITEDGQGPRMLGGFLDVTAQRQTESRLQKAQKLDAVGSLTAGVAHNFNNMLAIILPALEATLGKAAVEDQEMLEDALHAATGAAELVTQLMTFTGQRPRSDQRAEDLGAVLGRALSMCRRTFEQQVKIESAIAVAGAVVVCDPAAIEQVVVNLLINARDAVVAARRSEPRIVVELSELELGAQVGRVEPSAEYLRIRVTDNGVGMSDSVKQRVFEPFFTTKEVGKGTGLGLATSYGIVREHGGFIALESEPGLGTTVDVFLPRAHKGVTPAKAASEPFAAGPRRNILLVDDEPAIRRIVSLMLRVTGHSVRYAADGAAAVKLLDAGFAPDLILLDRSMPGWPVTTTIEQMRRRQPAVPIVFFTGQDVPDEERAQVQGVLHKPLTTDALLREIALRLDGSS